MYIPGTKTPAELERRLVCELTLGRGSELVLCLDTGAPPTVADRSNDLFFFIADFNGAEGFPVGGGTGGVDSLRFSSFLRGAGVGN